MKLVAMVMARNEQGRYLKWVLPALNEFCDEIRAVDDCSNDGTYTTLFAAGAKVLRFNSPSFYVHEGRARQRLLDWTLEAVPSHILAIDCDELVEDGPLIRCAIEQGSRDGVWNLSMTEVWKADEGHLYERVDGKWGARRCPIVFEVPHNVKHPRIAARWKIADRQLASGREPTAIAKLGWRTREPDVCKVFHFGWACQADRLTRYERYVKHDGGRFHADAHLQSIMNDDSQVGLRPVEWPASWGSIKGGLLERINRDN